jgi:tetratricopeptide (TPR) repeat protein
MITFTGSGSKASHGIMAPAAVAALTGMLACIPLHAGQASALESMKRQELAGMEETFSRVATSRGKDPAMKAFCGRLKLIDKVTRLLLGRFEATKTASLDKMLGEALGETVTPAVTRSPRAAQSALEILAEYQDDFATKLSLPPAPEKELRFLREYYSTTARVASKYIARRGREFGRVEQTLHADALEVCVVLPYLQVTDANWTRRDIEKLPQWMRTVECLNHLEKFSLRARRPQTAFQFSMYRQRRVSSRPAGTLTYVGYLSAAAESLFELRDYHTAIHCLRAGIREAKKDRKPDSSSADLRFRLANILEKTGHSRLAAEEMQQVMQAYPKCTQWGKAAMLRLKYLYQAEGFEAIAAEAEKYQKDKRCASYLPQVMYISWVTHRRLNRPEVAGRLKKGFLEKFPQHPLCADMYFASAMTALASSDYEEATRLLELVEYRYPKSRVFKKAKRIRERLERTALPKK